jgi:hypothetical protein
MFDLRRIGMAAGGAGAGNFASGMGTSFGPLSLLDAPRRAVAGALMSGSGPGYGPQPELTFDAPPGMFGADLGPAPRGPSDLRMSMRQQIGDPMLNGELFGTQMGEAPMLPPQKQGSWVPALAGVAAGVMSAPFLGTMAPLLGAGVAGAFQQGGEAMGLLDSFSTEEVTGSENPLVNALAGVAMDPLTLAGGIAGWGRAAAASAGPQARLAKFAAADEAALARPGLDALRPPMRSMAAGADEMAMAARPDMTASLRSPGVSQQMAPPTLGGYEPDQLATMLGGGASDYARSGMLPAGKAYKNVNPDVGGLLRYLGMANEQNQLAGGAAGLPSWAGVRGGRVMGAPGAQGTLSHLGDLAGMGGSGHDARMRLLERMKMMQASL